MDVLISFYKTTVGKKVLMAVTGVVLFAFVIGHMLGNLKLFLGFDPVAGEYVIDHYARHLRLIGVDMLGEGTFLWIVRLVLLGCVALHAFAAVQLFIVNTKAKPLGYQITDYGSATIASRTMIYGGIFLAFFILFHILHLTLGLVDPDHFKEGEVYMNLYFSFQHGYLTLIYVLGVGALALHLYHGAWSVFQSLGIDNPELNLGLRMFAQISAIGLFIGFSSVPFAVYMNLVAAPIGSL